MDVGTVFSMAQTFFAALPYCSQLEDLFSLVSHKQNLDNLKRTVDTVKAMLDDAESMQDQRPLLKQAQLYIDQLTDVVYDAEDLFDDLTIITELEKLKNGGTLSQKVSRPLFSCCNSLCLAHKTSQRVKRISHKFESVAKVFNNLWLRLEDFNFGFDCQHARRRRDTSSFENTQDIIGRQVDMDKIISKLSDLNVERDVSCLAIVGIGGLGKTALAQLVYNDPRIEGDFSLRLWTCVSDETQKALDVSAILRKILHLITEQNHNYMELEPLQKKIREQLQGKKFFLVLDDMWCENRHQWLGLEKFLLCGLRGSWILVTTRSEKTAIAIGDRHPYILKGLSDGDSWKLFEIMAFGQRDEQVDDTDLEEIGRGIVKKCANVPLAIRVAGSLLYGYGKDKWMSFQNIKLGENEGIEPILKLSYHQLESPLKTCFSYCALFPKDHVIQKDMLINLWMALDYVVPLPQSQSIEHAGAEYFDILLKRCFFQDVGKDQYGNIVSCKIHDLMHDIAEQVSSKVVVRKDSITESLDSRVRHLSYVSANVSNNRSFGKIKIHTCLHLSQWGKCTSVATVLRYWRCLRILDLSESGIKVLPSGLGKLLHLRYLDLSGNDELKMLPETITKLLHLQTINLQRCWSLRELPRDLANLAKLRVLDMGNASFQCLQFMPPDMGKLSGLVKLSLFVVGGQKKSTLKHNVVDQMRELKALVNLKGHLCIRIHRYYEYAEGDAREGGYIRNKEHLDHVQIEFAIGSRMPDNGEDLLLEHLQPHPNLKDLNLREYWGSRMPSWAREDQLAACLPNLIKIDISGYHRLKHLCSMGKLRHLKSLTVRDMDRLECIESRSMRNDAGDSVSETFFPSLKQLTLRQLPKLKGWWRENDSNGSEQLHLFTSFPCLSHLEIVNCHELATVPGCPTLEKMELVGSMNEKPRIMNSIGSGNSKLREVSTWDARLLKSALPREALECLEELMVEHDDHLKSLSEVEEVFRSCSSSLRLLQISWCSSLKSVGGGLKHLTSLKELELCYLEDLSMSDDDIEEGDDGMPWRSLHSLKLESLPKMVKLPKGIRYLTALHSLEIVSCQGLKEVPESMQELTSLTTLEIRDCSEGLWKRCQENTGQDWPNIQHIPNCYITHSFYY